VREGVVVALLCREFSGEWMAHENVTLIFDIEAWQN